MEVERFKKLLQAVKQNRLSVADALKKMEHLPFADLEFAKIDFHRPLRQGIPEVIFGMGKEIRELEQIIARMRKQKMNVLVTRLEPDKARALRKKFKTAQYNARARTLKIIAHKTAVAGKGKILIISAGTSDLAVAEEARETAEFLGNRVQTIYDVVVAGLHRLMAFREEMSGARVLIVVAGMEGALPSVVAGLVGKPVIGVPTSIGYGASMKGLSALFGMLNTCANGLAVVNIDNGYGAAAVASLINRL
jgi:pyridinium-3,5-biscarboxylic acid mononucleotide synthase